jgi:hypothetical protein
MARRHPIRYGHSQLAYNARYYFLERVSLICRLPAIPHFAKHHSLYSIQLASQHQLHQHTVNLVRLRRHVLEK